MWLCLYHARESAKLFDVFEDKFNVSVAGLPIWLENVRLARSCNVLGERMRHIHVSEVMEGLYMIKLSGVATLVVLCTGFAEERSSIQRLLESLLLCTLGGVVQNSPGQEGQDIPYTFNPHIGKFVSSCIDADQDSDQSNTARRWMAWLSEYGSLNEQHLASRHRKINHASCRYHV